MGISLFNHRLVCSLLAAALLTAAGTAADAATPRHPPSARGQAPQVTLHVDNQHPSASDTAPGTAAAPLLSIQEAVDRALENKRNALATRVVVHAGTYRESVSFLRYTNHPDSQPNNTTPMLFEAQPPGSVVLSGSDVFPDWQAVGAGLYEAPWLQDWGLYTDDPTGVPELSQRREMVFENGTLLTQVLTRAELTNGSFHVDEETDRLTIDPLGNAPGFIEVALRDRIWRQEWESHVTVRGFVIEHAATAWRNGYAALGINGGTNVLLEDLNLRWNNGNGVFLTGENMTLRNSQLSDNGYNAWGTWRLKDLLIEDVEANRNNWRGHLTGFMSWSVGNKLFGVHGLTVRRLTARDNFSRGLWLDYDLQDVVLEQLVLENNFRDGVFLEASPGPLVMRDSRICNNQQHGILTAHMENVILERVTLCDNRIAGLNASGDDGGREVVDWETDESSVLTVRDWTIQNSCFSEARDLSPEPLLFMTTLSNSWTPFRESYLGFSNTWHHTEANQPLRIMGGVYTDLAGFSAEVTEINSVFRSSNAFSCPVLLFADGFESGTPSRWQ